MRGAPRGARLHAAARGSGEPLTACAACRFGYPRLRSACAKLRTLYEDARRANIATFGYSEFQAATTFVATSTGVARAVRSAWAKSR